MRTSAPIIALVIGALVVLATLALVARQVHVSRMRGVFDCVLWRRGVRGREGWQQGLMRFTSQELQWFRALSWRIRPERRIGRCDILGEQRSVIGEKTPGGEDYVLVELTLRQGARVRVIMARSAASALNAWLESAPMGLVIGDAD
ncbi:DUF2550 family protein [Brachybacterium phenoliresistens]|uniref:DUF2550 family protein n=1 Tax=Brachybacterium phenoliresistens TaxID=396014 RepID=Z9JY15_9MICO|nr:DUF2550 family protein [Brachybacterium phenoliresistens]EWS83019.1 hypothetical protein BF93_00175 [Brachybacterium phenoliresistens]